MTSGDGGGGLETGGAQNPALGGFWGGTGSLELATPAASGRWHIQNEKVMSRNN